MKIEEDFAERWTGDHGQEAILKDANADDPTATHSPEGQPQVGDIGALALKAS